MIIGFAVLPFFTEGIFSIGDINMLGRYMSFAILALGLGLLWGYVGILAFVSLLLLLRSLCMGMHLAHHGGPEGIIDANGWKIPACLFVVYPYDVGESSGMLCPRFWKPFWNLPLTLILGVLIPGLTAFCWLFCFP